MNLQKLNNALLNDGLSSRAIDATEDLPLDRINVEYDIDDTSMDFFTQISNVETNLGDDSMVELMQFYSPFPILIEENKLQKVVDILPSFNQLPPIGAFNLQEDEHILYHRHIAVVPLGDSGTSVVLESTWLIHYAINNLGKDLVNLILSNK